MLTKCWSNAGPPSAALAQHQTSTGWTPRVCWAAITSRHRDWDRLCGQGRSNMSPPLCTEGRHNHSAELSEMKWNESGFRPPLCTYRLNWARRTSWGWWDYWDDTVLQTQDSKFEPWRSEAEHATSRSRRLPTILTFTRGRGRNIFVSFKPPRLGTEPRTLAWKAAVLTTTLGPPPLSSRSQNENLKKFGQFVDLFRSLCFFRWNISRSCV